LEEFYAVLGMVIGYVQRARVDAMRELASLQGETHFDERRRPAVPPSPGSEDVASNPTKPGLPRPTPEHRTGRAADSGRPVGYFDLVHDPVTHTVTRHGYPHPVCLQEHHGVLLWNLFHVLFEARERGCSVAELRANWKKLGGRTANPKRSTI